VKADYERTDTKQQGQDKWFGMMVARDGIEPPTPAFSGLGEDVTD
jgi:hypothetical protein